MKKYTKKQYGKDLAAANAELAAISAKLDRLDEYTKRYAERRPRKGLPQLLLNLWERYQDLEYAANDKIDTIEYRYAHRNWTAADWNTQALVAMNID